MNARGKEGPPALRQAAESLLARLEMLEGMGVKALAAEKKKPAPPANLQPPVPPAPPSEVSTPKQVSLFARPKETRTEQSTTPPPDPRQAAADLEKLRQEIGQCQRCRLHQGRSNIVFGEGHPAAQLVFAGEGPGHDEDVTGRPFVGRAGQLLDRMIAAMGLKREQCYICNVVKCRPPENRTPQEDEMRTCGLFLARQLEIIRPRMIVALGATAARYLLNTNQPMGKLRGRFFPYSDFAELMPTFHPAYLLRNPSAKREVWQDLQQVMAKLGLSGGAR